MSEYNKFNSRKWKLVLLAVILATVGCFVPPLISSWVFKTKELILITGTEWVSVITLVVSTYFAANVFQKKIDGYVANDTKNEEDEV